MQNTIMTAVLQCFAATSVVYNAAVLCKRSAAHRQEIKSNVMEDMLLWPMHAVGKLREDAVHVLKACSQQDGLPPVPEKG